MRTSRTTVLLASILAMAVAVIATGCVQPLPPANTIVASTPILNNSGKYMCPYTQDEVLAKWLDDAMKVRAATGAGKIAGAYIGRKLFENIPMVGGIIGQKVGGELARQAAIKACGGWEHIKSTSDISFNSLDKMAVYIYAKHSTHAHYGKALKATMDIYPDLARRYDPAIRRAPRKAVAAVAN